jgi:5-(carboxyamino)imidazole ribonucleotide mutase
MEPMSTSSPIVGVVMGSQSDLELLRPAADTLAELGIAHEVRVVSAHRTPDHMVDYAHRASGRGLKVIIAGAGGAAHLPGMLAALCTLPVIGVPVPLKYFDGLDSLLSILQMPAGVPVATVAVGGARNAGLLAARILAVGDPRLQVALGEIAAAAAAKSLADDRRVVEDGQTGRASG